MPPKKKGPEQPTIPPMFGRMGTNLRIGIVGLPNVGKSTFFNVLTKSSAPAENFPFCTIDPNEARVAVPDTRFDSLVKYHKPASTVPAYLNIVDIAGLVKGANEGQGLGNAFLSHISGCDAIFHMLRVFSDKDVTHVEGEVDPVRDIQIINDELRLKDLAKIEKPIADLKKLVDRGGTCATKEMKFEYEVLCKVNAALEEGKHVRFLDWNDKEVWILNKHLFLTSKPMIYLLNLSKKDYLRKKNKWLGPIKQKVDEIDKGAVMIPYSAEFELEYFDADDEGKKALEAPSMLTKIIKTGYSGLGLIYFFTAGEDEVRAWTLRKYSTAPKAAGRIHTDFEKGFIMAEVMDWAAWEEGGSEAEVKAMGRYRQQGKSYIVQDGDIIFFKFNTPNAPKKK